MNDIVDHVYITTKDYAAKDSSHSTTVPSKDELWLYFAVMFVTGVIQYPSMEDYWKITEFFNCPIIRQLLPRKRFWEISSSIHCDIKEKSSTLEKTMVANFKKYWTPGTAIAIDETLILFKGRFAGRQHMPCKPHSTGIKMFGCADSKGYLLSLWLYKGADKQERQAKPKDIVMDFTQEFSENKDKIVFYMDSYYGGLNLAIDLAEKGFQFVMTCKSDRPSFLFKNFLQLKLKKRYV